MHRWGVSLSVCYLPWCGKALDCAKKYSLIAADLEDYDTALDSFTELAQNCLNTNLTKFNARGYFFKAGLILLAQG